MAEPAVIADTGKQGWQKVLADFSHTGASLPPPDLTDDLRARVALLRPPLIFLIVVFHTPRYAVFAADPGLASFIAALFNQGLVRISLPMLSCISGYLLFRAALDLRFTQLLRKRGTSLLLPMLLWNLPLALALYFVQANGWLALDSPDRLQLAPFDWGTWLNAVFAINDFPVLVPLHFLRDLFVLCLLAPVLGFCIRRLPWPGLVAVLVVYFGDLDGQLIRTNSMLPCFYFGGLAALRHWNLRTLDRWALPLMGLLLVTCAAIVLLDAGRPAWLPLLGPFVVWPLSALLVNTAFGRWSARQSRLGIFLFLFHCLPLLVLRALWPQLYSGSPGDLSFLLWLGIPLAVSALAWFVYRMLARSVPGLLNLLLGGRG